MAEFGVWYRYTATTPVDFTFGTHGSDYDTIVTGWVGSCGALSLRFCDAFDDDAARPPNLAGTGRMLVSLGVGDEVFILVSDENDGTGGNLEVEVTASEVFQSSFVEEDGWYPSVGANTAGDFLVAWHGGSGPSNEIQARRYDADGTVLSPPFVVAPVDAYRPAVSGAGTGFVVAWDDGLEVGAQRLDASGAPVGAPIVVDDGGFGYMDAAANDAGEFVVAWDASPGDRIHARSFDAAGTPVGPTVTVSAGEGRDPQVAMAPDGTFVVVWTDQEGTDGDEYGVLARRFDDAASPLGAPFVVNTYTTDAQGNSGVGITMDPAGNFVVVWTDRASRYGLESNIMGRRFDDAGTALGGEFRVNTDAFGTGYYGQTFGDDSNYYPAVASDAGGNFVVVWNRMYSGPYARVFDSAGVPQGAEFQVSHRIDDYQYYLDVGANAAGAFLVAWNHEVTNAEDIVLGRHFAGPLVPGDCAPAPLPGCKKPTTEFKGRLALKAQGPSLTWKWVKGEATSGAEVGDPLATDAYTFCLYDGGGTLVSEATAAPGGLCGTSNPKPCWKALGTPPGAKGYKYVHKETNADGVQKLILKPGDAGRAKAIVKAKGAALDAPALPLLLPATAQLQATTGTCWSAAFTTAGVLKNTDTVFAGKASVPAGSPSGAFLESPRPMR
jgi:hypothetical protein